MCDYFPLKQICTGVSLGNFLLDVSSCNEASWLCRYEDSTFNIIIGPDFIHYFCQLILHLDWQCVDLWNEHPGYSTLANIRKDIAWPVKCNKYTPWSWGRWFVPLQHRPWLHSQHELGLNSRNAIGELMSLDRLDHFKQWTIWNEWNYPTLKKLLWRCEK